jgi:hypothetical protein
LHHAARAFEPARSDVVALAHLKDGSSQADSMVAADRMSEQAAVETGVSISSRRCDTAMPARKK